MNIPHHVAIIMDGNGRWAARRGLPKIMGHNAGTKGLDRVLEAADELGIKVLTVYAFSTENWKRSKVEVAAIMRLMSQYIEKNGRLLSEKNIRFTALGRVDALPRYLSDKIRKFERATKGHTGLHLCIAVNYGGRDEIINAAKGVFRDIKRGKISASDIDKDLFSGYLYTAGIPDPDLLIRTSGEMRISNFLLWQLSYSEIYVTPKLWPDFTKADLKKAVDEYSRRSRRFGGRNAAAR